MYKKVVFKISYTVYGEKKDDVNYRITAYRGTKIIPPSILFSHNNFGEVIHKKTDVSEKLEEFSQDVTSLLKRIIDHSGSKLNLSIWLIDMTSNMVHYDLEVVGCSADVYARVYDLKMLIVSNTHGISKTSTSMDYDDTIEWVKLLVDDIRYEYYQRLCLP